MDVHADIQSKNSFILNLLFRILFGMIGYIGCVTAAKPLLNGHVSIAACTLFFLSSAFCLYQISCLKDLNRLHIRNGQIEVRWFLGKKKRTIHFDDIKSYTQICKKEQKGRPYEMTLYTSKGKLTIFSEYYWNYDEMTAAFSNWKLRDIKKEDKIQSRREWIIGLGIILAVVCAFYLAFTNPTT